MTVVRLAWGGPPEALAKALGPMTSVRLAVSERGNPERMRSAFGQEEGMTTVRLAAGSRPQRKAQEHPGGGLPAPALLVSYFYLDRFLRERERYCFRDWSMDSGAYSAANAGAVIDRAAYHETCLRLQASDPQLVEVFALDVIGDWRATMANTVAAWEAGIRAIPTYHVGEPEAALVAMAAEFPKIALGGAVRYPQRRAWAAQCFARVWPKPIHGLGFGSESALMALPFHSVDASNWELLPTAYGRWKAFGQLSVRGGEQNLRAEVEWYLRLEERTRARWAREMAQLDQMLQEART